ncbi:unnamed protein product [Closterium sp. Yama58-4]|nr:unnamed protein product [Closterium sp. Yama58-4]
MADTASPSLAVARCSFRSCIAANPLIDPFTNYMRGAAIHANNTATLSVSLSSFRNGSSAMGGAGIMALRVANLTVTACGFRGNHAFTPQGGGGAALEGQDSNVTILHSWFLSNQSTRQTRRRVRGGALLHAWGMMGNDPVRMEVEDCVFEGNTARFAGGASFESDAVVRRTRFIRNAASFRTAGAALFLREATVEGCEFSALFLREATVEGCEFSGNTVLHNGGAIVTGGVGPTNITHTAFLNNTALSGEGGAIYVQELFLLRGNNTHFLAVFSLHRACRAGHHRHSPSCSLPYASPESGQATTGTVLVSHSLFLNNSALLSKGGAIAFSGNILTIDNSTFVNNSALVKGGAISVEVASTAAANGTLYPVTVAHSRFLSNRADLGGGAISLSSQAALSALNCSLLYCRSGSGGAVLIEDFGRLRLHRSRWEGSGERDAGGQARYRVMGDVANPVAGLHVTLLDAAGVVASSDDSVLVEVVPSPYISGELRATAVGGTVTVPPITIVQVPPSLNPAADPSAAGNPSDTPTGNPTAASTGGEPIAAAYSAAPTDAPDATAGVLSLAVAVSSPLNAFPPFQRTLEVVFCPAGHYCGPGRGAQHCPDGTFSFRPGATSPTHSPPSLHRLFTSHAPSHAILHSLPSPLLSNTSLNSFRPIPSPPFLSPHPPSHPPHAHHHLLLPPRRHLPSDCLPCSNTTADRTHLPAMTCADGVADVAVGYWLDPGSVEKGEVVVYSSQDVPPPAAAEATAWASAIGAYGLPRSSSRREIVPDSPRAPVAAGGLGAVLAVGVPGTPVARPGISRREIVPDSPLTFSRSASRRAAPPDSPASSALSTSPSAAGLLGLPGPGSLGGFSLSRSGSRRDLSGEFSGVLPVVRQSMSRSSSRREILSEIEGELAAAGLPGSLSRSLSKSLSRSASRRERWNDGSSNFGGGVVGGVSVAELTLTFQRHLAILVRVEAHRREDSLRLLLRSDAVQDIIAWLTSPYCNAEDQRLVLELVRLMREAAEAEAGGLQCSRHGRASGNRHPAENVAEAETGSDTADRRVLAELATAISLAERILQIAATASQSRSHRLLTDRIATRTQQLLPVLRRLQASSMSLIHDPRATFVFERLVTELQEAKHLLETSTKASVLGIMFRFKRRSEIAERLETCLAEIRQCHTECLILIGQDNFHGRSTYAPRSATDVPPATGGANTGRGGIGGGTGGGISGDAPERLGSDYGSAGGGLQRGFSTEVILPSSPMVDRSPRAWNGGRQPGAHSPRPRALPRSGSDGLPEQVSRGAHGGHGVYGGGHGDRHSQKQQRRLMPELNRPGTAGEAMPMPRSFSSTDAADVAAARGTPGEFSMDIPNVRRANAARQAGGSEEMYEDANGEMTVSDYTPSRVRHASEYPRPPPSVSSICSESDHARVLVSALIDGSPAEKRAALAALLELAESDEGKLSVAAAGAVPVLSVLLTLPDSPGEPTKLAAARVLLRLACLDENRVVIAKAGCVPSFVSLLRTGGPEARAVAARVLWNLAVNTENKVIIAASEAVPSLVAIIQSDSQSEAKQEAAEALAQLTANNVKNQTAVAEAGGVPALVTMLKEGSPPEQEKAALALGTLAVNHDENKLTVAGAGACPLLLDLLCQNNHPEASKNAAWALYVLSSNKVSATYILASGGLVAVKRQYIFMELRTELLKLLPLVHPTPGLGSTGSRGLPCDVTKAKTAFAPYRICPLGAHIDHQGGSVLAAAINTGVRFLFLPTPTPQVSLLPPTSPSPPFLLPLVCSSSSSHLVIHTHSPSSTDLLVNLHLHFDQRQTGVAFLLALADANNLSLSPSELIELDRLIENGFLGLRNGVLDQSAIVLSKAGHLTRIWCQDRRHDFIPLPAGSASGSDEQDPIPPVAFMLAFSGMQATLTSSSGYNNRVQECQEAARMLLATAGLEVPSSPVLSQVPLHVFKTHEDQLPEELRRRATHFFSESARVLQGAEALQQGDWRLFGRLMSESGQSSIDQYECGSPPLKELRSILLATPGVLGARFSGAGFRGCCVALVEREKVADVARHVAEEYSRSQPELAAACQKDGMVVVCDISDGAWVV